MIAVSKVAPCERESVLRLLFFDLPASEQQAGVDKLLSAERAGDVNLDRLLVATRAGRPCGVALSVAQPDRTLLVWAPLIVDAPSHVEEIADALLDDVGRSIDEEGFAFGQCLLELDEERDRRRLARNGFVHLTDLVFLEHDLDLPERRPDRPRFSRETFDPQDNAERFAALLERSYQATRDCPELNQCRDGAAALAGHQTAGRFDPSRWLLYQLDGEDVGALLLTEHPDRGEPDPGECGRTWELVYLGLAPEFRGRGYGRELVLDGLFEARAAGAARLTLAVDSRNDYARALYDSCGFVETERRAAHLRWPRVRSDK